MLFVAGSVCAAPADGHEQQELALPAKPILGGITAVAGRVYVTTADGTVTCFAALQ